MWCLAQSECSISVSYNYYKLLQQTTQARQDTVSLYLASCFSPDLMTPAYFQPRARASEFFGRHPSPSDAILLVGSTLFFVFEGPSNPKGHSRSQSRPPQMTKRKAQPAKPARTVHRECFQGQTLHLPLRSQHRIVSTKSEIMLPDPRTSKTQPREESGFASFSPLHYPSLSLKTFL